MIIGKDILPNVFINNIQIFDNKLKYDVLIFDSKIEPAWSNKKMLKSTLKLKHTVLVDSQKINDIKDGVIPFAFNEQGVETKLVSRMMNFDIDDIESLNDQVCYIKTCSYNLPFKYNDISIFANVFVESIAEQGPVASEPVIKNGSIVTTTNTLFKGQDQYYGPVHYHEGVYMEGKVHKSTQHSVLDVRSATNLKIKDERTKIYKKKTFLKDVEVPVFSGLLPSFGMDTKFNYMFFINIEEMLIKNSKFGKFYNYMSEFDKEDLLNEVSFSSIRINRKAYTKNTKKLYDTRSIISGFEPSTGGFVSTSGDKLEFISHKISPAIRAIKFHDDSLSQNSSGDYKYDIELLLSDVSIGFIDRMIDVVSIAIDRLENFSNALKINKNYDKNIKKAKDSIYQTFFVRNSLSLRYSQLFVDMKKFLYDINQSEEAQLLINGFVHISPQTCTIESVEKFIVKFSSLYREFLKTYELDKSPVKRNYQKKLSPKSFHYTNKIIVNHQFKNTISPSGVRLHYVLETGDEVTSENLNTSVSSSPKQFGSSGNLRSLKNPIINLDLKEQFRKRNPPFTITATNNENTTIPFEKFNNVSEYLGDDSKFNSFSDEEKCENPTTVPIIAEEVELIVISESGDVKKEMENFTTKVELLSGFKKNKIGKLIVTQPLWTMYTGDYIERTLVTKQTPIGDVKKIIDYPFPNKYRLLNNSKSYKFQDLNNSIRQSANPELVNELNNFQTVSPLFSQGSIVLNKPVLSQTVEAINRVSPVVMQTQPSTQSGPLPEGPVGPVQASPTTQATTPQTSTPTPMSTPTTYTGGY